MTPEQRRAIRILSGVVFLPFSFDKRFVKDMVRKLIAEIDHEENTVTLSEKQHNCLMLLEHKYRRQHGRCHCLECLKNAMGKDNPYQLTMFGEREER